MLGTGQEGWAPPQTHRFLREARDWQAVEDFYRHLVAGSVSLADLQTPSATVSPSKAASAVASKQSSSTASLPHSRDPAKEEEEQIGGQQHTKTPAASLTPSGTAASGRSELGSTVIAKRTKNERHTYKVTLSYFGPASEGWAWHKDKGRTVEGVLRTALAPLVATAWDPHKQVGVSCAGRTDLGVSALGQVVSFPSWNAISDEQLREAVGSAAAPGSLRVVSIQRMPRTFHATFQALVHAGAMAALYLPVSSTGGLWRSSSAVPSDEKPCIELSDAELRASDDTEVDCVVMNRLLGALEGRTLDCTAFARDTAAGKDCVCHIMAARAVRLRLPPAAGGTSTATTASVLPAAAASAGVQHNRHARNVSSTVADHRAASAAEEGAGEVVLVEIVANRFLRRMVRVLVATAIREATQQGAWVRRRSPPGQPASTGLMHGTPAACIASGCEHVAGGSGCSCGEAAEGAAEQRHGLPVWVEPQALLRLATQRDRRATGPPAPALGLCFAEAGYASHL